MNLNPPPDEGEGFLQWVAARVAPTTRRTDLTWAHHAAVAPLSDADFQRPWLDRAAQRRWSPAKLRAAIALEMDKMLEVPMLEHTAHPNCRCI